MFPTCTVQRKMDKKRRDGESVLRMRENGVLCCVSLSKIPVSAGSGSGPSMARLRSWYFAACSSIPLLLSTPTNLLKPRSNNFTQEKTRNDKTNWKISTWRMWMCLVRSRSLKHTDFSYLFSNLSSSTGNIQDLNLATIPREVFIQEVCCHRWQHEVQHVHILLNKCRLFLWQLSPLWQIQWPVCFQYTKLSNTRHSNCIE